MNTDKQKYYVRTSSKGFVFVKDGKVMPPKVVLSELRRGDRYKQRLKELRNEV